MYNNNIINKVDSKLVDYNIMISLLLCYMYEINNYFDIYLNDNYCISKYGRSNLEVTDAVIFKVLKSLSNDFAKIIKKHYYFRPNLEAFRIGLNKWLNKLLKKLDFKYNNYINK